MTISAGALIGSSLIAGGSALANKWIEKRRYERQLDDQHKLWQENNDYNSPAAQMARLKAAGLNPNLVYQNGGVLSPSDQLTPPDWQNSPINEFNSLGEMAIQGFNAEQDASLKKATANKTKAETAEILSETGSKDSLLGKALGLSTMQDTEREYYSSLLGVPLSQLGTLSIRGATQLNSLMRLAHDKNVSQQTRDNLEQTWRVLNFNASQAEADALYAWLGQALAGLNLQNEFQKSGYNYDVTVYDKDGSIFKFGKQYQTEINAVVEEFLRRYKEMRWQSSDFKHIVDTFSELSGSVGLGTLLKHFGKKSLKETLK